MIRVTYTCVGTEQVRPVGTSVQHRATLRLDSQPGTPIRHWGSMPHSIVIAGEDAQATKLGDQFTLTFERVVKEDA